MWREVVRSHAASLAIHAGVAGLAMLVVPLAGRTLAPPRREAIRIDIRSAPARAAAVKEAPPAEAARPPEPAQPPPPAPRPARVPERARVALAEAPRPFREGAEVRPEDRPAPADTPALPGPTAPLPEVSMDGQALAGAATEYVTTSSGSGTMGVRAGPGGGRGGVGGGRGAPGPLSGQEAVGIQVSPDWEVTRQAEPLNDRDFEPEYPALARREGREGQVVVRLWIDAEGKVEHAAVVEGAGRGFDEAALAYARRLRFAPARAGTVKVASRIEWTVEFHARDR